MQVLTSLFAVLGLAFVYVGAALVFMRITHLQIDPQRSVSEEYITVSSVIVHPGILFKLFPVIAIVVTWIGLAAAKRRSVVSKTAA